MARAVVEGQAFAHLAMIASDRQDERWLCDVEQAARARTSEQLRLEISSLREGAAPPTLSALPFVVLVVDIIVNFWRARALHRTAMETKSQALEADASSEPTGWPRRSL